jgi:hypothetical protein
MRQASWIAFLLLTIGLVTYEASVDETVTATSEMTDAAPPTDEGGGGFPTGGGPR